ncbi:MAG: IS630 family transposase [Hormoscilla sp. GM7CHS1pb]|nr:IS630 family transposase [Hormoscilla sp. GM7CHS1pb]
MSKDTIKRILKNENMSWRRIRKRVGGEPEPTEYQEKKKELKKLKEQEDRGEIDLIFFDETGFCLNAYVPYAWQEHGEVIEVKSKKSRRLNVLGFLNRKNELDPYLFECQINSEVVISCIDDFCSTLKKKTVLVMDNASTHTSNAVKNKQEEWEKKELTIFYLPTYSPQLNIIEILWRFIKYSLRKWDAPELERVHPRFAKIDPNFCFGLAWENYPAVGRRELLATLDDSPPVS